MKLPRRWYLRLKRRLGYETPRERRLRLIGECLQRRFDAVALDLLIQAANTHENAPPDQR